MFYSHVIDDALESKVGKSGLPQASLDRELARASAALDRFRQWKADGTLPLLSLPGARDDLALLKPHAERFARFEHVIVLGTGGSSLGGQTLVALKDQGFGPPERTPEALVHGQCRSLDLHRTGRPAAAGAHRPHRDFQVRQHRRDADRSS